MDAFFEKRLYSTSLRVWACKYWNLTFLPHYHREFEIIYLREGSAQIYVNGQLFKAQKGDLFVCQSADVHYLDEKNANNCLDFLIFDPDIIKSVFSKSENGKIFIKAGELKKTGMDEICERVFQSVHNELKKREKGFDALITLSLCEFWVQYIRNFSVLSTERTVDMSVSKLQKLMSHIDENFAENVNLSDAAKIMGYDIFYCSKMFKKFVGVNFTKYVNSVRIGNAVDMLRSSDESITQIAMKCGFSNIRTFNRVFKEILGITPTEFLKTNKTVMKEEQNQVSHMTSAALSYIRSEE